MGAAQSNADIIAGRGGGLQYGRAINEATTVSDFSAPRPQSQRLDPNFVIKKVHDKVVGDLSDMGSIVVDEETIAGGHPETGEIRVTLDNGKDIILAPGDTVTLSNGTTTTYKPHDRTMLNNINNGTVVAVRAMQTLPHLDTYLKNRTIRRAGYQRLTPRSDPYGIRSKIVVGDEAIAARRAQQARAAYNEAQLLGQTIEEGWQRNYRRAMGHSIQETGVADPVGARMMANQGHSREEAAAEIERLRRAANVTEEVEITAQETASLLSPHLRSTRVPVVPEVTESEAALQQFIQTAQSTQGAYRPPPTPFTPAPSAAPVVSTPRGYVNITSELDAIPAPPRVVPIASIVEEQVAITNATRGAVLNTSRIMGEAAEVASVTARGAARVAGEVAPFVTPAFAAVEGVYTEVDYAEGRITDRERTAQHGGQVGEVGGTIAGGALGTAVGTAAAVPIGGTIGGAIGFFFGGPPGAVMGASIGTAAAPGIGGFFGSLGGFFGGNAAGQGLGGAGYDVTHLND